MHSEFYEFVFCNKDVSRGMSNINCDVLILFCLQVSGFVSTSWRRSCHRNVALEYSHKVRRSTHYHCPVIATVFDVSITFMAVIKAAIQAYSS